MNSNKLNLKIVFLFLAMSLGTTTTSAFTIFRGPTCDDYVSAIKKQQDIQEVHTIKIEKLETTLDIYKNELETLRLRLITQSFKKSPRTVASTIEHYFERLALYTDISEEITENYDARKDTINTRSDLEEKYEDNCSL